MALSSTYIHRLRGQNLYWLIKVVCGTAFMMYGYDAGVLGGFLLHKPFLDAIGNPTGQYAIPLISSAYSLAACFAALGLAFFTFRIGRRRTILLGNFAAIIGSIIQASSFSVAQLVVGRITTGFAIGCITSAVPAYLAETGIEVGDRGPANAFNAILLMSGVTVAYWMDYGFLQLQNQASWRVPITLQCVFAIISGTGFLFLPDTPRILYAKNQIEEGDDILARLYDAPIDSEQVQSTKREIFATIESELEAAHSLHWSQFITFGIIDKTPIRIIRRLVICFCLPLIRVWMGSSIVAYYSPIILQRAGAEPTLVSMLAGVLTVCFALGCVPTYFTIERVGRRSILLYGAITMMILMAIFTALQLCEQSQSVSWAGIGIIFAYLFTFGYAWQGCLWLYGSEISPLEYRHIGGAFTACGEWLMTWLTVFVAPIAFDNVGAKFWIFVLVGNCVGVVFVYFLCPETGGLTLEAIDTLFQQGGSIQNDAKATEEAWAETKETATVTEAEKAG